ncbi:hypothetical protein K8R78_02835 [bacterium]|nr:hypothetical protein [bacterium]
MAAQLVKIYEYINANATMPQKMQIAKISGISSNMAAKDDDTPDSVAKLTQAVQTVLGTAPM